jgi:RHS repeat-associated protein
MLQATARKLRGILLSVAMLVFGRVALAQEYTGYLLETGAPPWAVIEPVPMGFVNVANGNLHIEIPIVSAPQRGSRAFVGKMVYDSRIYKIVDEGVDEFWDPDNVETASPIDAPKEKLGWRFVGTGQGTATWDTLTYDCYSGGTQYNWYKRQNYRYIDPNGTIRRFPIYRETSNVCHTAGSQTQSGPALDASGHLMNNNSSYSDVEVIAPDGTTDYDDNTTLWKDPNGNSANTSHDSVTDTAIWNDTLNRSIVQTTELNYLSDSVTVFTSQGSSTFTLNYTQVGITTNFNFEDVIEYDPYPNPEGLESIELPDGSTYEFTYDSYGLLASMTFPNGRTISFTHTNVTDAQGNRNRWISTVTAEGGTWTYAKLGCGTNCQKVTVTRPSGDQTEYQFTINNGAWLTQKKSYTGTVASGTLLLTENHDYDFSVTDPIIGGAAFVRRIRTTTTLPGPAGNLVKKTEATHDTFTYNYKGTNYTGSRGNVLSAKEFAFGSGAVGALVREQVFTYLHDSNSSYIGKNIVNRLTNAQTKDSGGVKKAETITTYDSTSLTSVTGVTHHDTTNFGTGYTLRGNPTVIQSWIGSGSGCFPGGNGYLCTTLNYDITGQVVSSTDPKGNVTQFSYANSFFLDNGNNPPPAYTPTPPTTNAYVTQVTPPNTGSGSNVISVGYYYGSGKPAKQTDPNGNVTYSHFRDSLDRFTKANFSGGGWKQSEYYSTTQTNITGSITDTDNFGGNVSINWPSREVTSIVSTDPEGWVYQKTTRDTSGRVASVTNPYRSGSGNPTSYTYDGLNRVTQTALPGPPSTAYRNTFYGAAVGANGGRTTQLCDTATYGLGYPTLSKDELGKKRQVWVDAIGRLIEADEPDATGALTLGTCYRYDVLGNLTQVDQGSQTRSMTYDALSRLASETTPEAGTVSYFYTTSGGALCAGNASALCRMTDARSITTTYNYDAENRLIGKTYSNGDPSLSYFYDQTSYNGLTITNGKARRTGMSDGSGQTAWSYDSEGHVLTEKRTIAGITKSFSYAYNKNGSLKTITYPTGMVTPLAYNLAGRLISVSCSTPTCSNSTWVADNASYAPHGALASLRLGNVSGFAGTTIANTYNGRLQPLNMKATHTAGTVTVMDFTYSFYVGIAANDGHVKSVTNNLVTARSQTYTYDEMNRLKTATTQGTSGSNCWGQEYTYDRYANLSAMAIASTHAGCTGQTTLSLGISTTTNRITDSGFSYDAAGNLLGDGFSTYTWNAEGRMAATAGLNYTYDADGRRTKKAAGSPSSHDKLYWYGLNGEVLAESDLSGTVLYEYVYFNGQRVARRTVSGGAWHYYVGDRLGSARVVVGNNGSVVEESDFLPYGSERAIVNTLDNNYKFTGHERDTESGLDHTLHRQYASNLGRWQSPDRVRGEIGNPQSSNRYAYAWGNPCNMIDPDGAFPSTASWHDHWTFSFGVNSDLQQRSYRIDSDESDFAAERRVYWAAQRRLKAAAEIALEALKNSPCASQFQTDGPGLDPSEVLEGLVRSGEGGGPSRFGVLDFRDELPVNKTAWAETDIYGEYVGMEGERQVYEGVNVRINYNTWNSNSAAENARTLLHELGHAFNVLAGAGGSAWVSEYADDGRSIDDVKVRANRDNRDLVCVPLGEP